MRESSSRCRNEASSPLSRSSDIATRHSRASSASCQAAGRRRAGRARSSIPATRTPSSRTGRGGRARAAAPAPRGTDRRGVARRARDRARAGQRREVVEADLDARSCGRCGRAARGRSQSWRGEPLERRLQLGEPLQVAVEGRLARLGLAHPLGLQRPRRPRSRASRAELRAEPAAEPLRELGCRAVAASRSSALDSRAARAARPSSGRCRVSARGRRPRSARAPPRRSARGSRSACRRRRRPWPRACSGRCRSSRRGRSRSVHRALQPPRRRAPALDPGQVEVGLVEAHLLDAVDVLAQRRPSPSRERAR